MDDLSSSSNYSASSLIELSHNFVYELEKQPWQNTIPLSSSSSSDSSYRYKSLLEATAKSPWNNTPSWCLSQGQATIPLSPSSSLDLSYGYKSLLEATAKNPWNNTPRWCSSQGQAVSFEAHAGSGWSKTCPGVTIPKDISLSSKNTTGGFILQKALDPS